jgi:spermidine/putrescine transport system ATP-binding protein
MDLVKTPDEQSAAAGAAQQRAGTREPAIELVGIAKRFQSRRGTVTAVERVDLVIGEGEFFSLLGPSGCGKTTTLRMIGGFEEPTEGQILLYGNDVVGVPPNHRDVNMVFQSYALFPHMSVFENVAFGLRRKAVSRTDTTQRVNEMLELVQLEGKSDRRPRELSGGQQQRVALARALVNRPRALLLDEPLAALDLKLRQAMQIELKRIQREVGITFIFVTHDQNEALTMSDRLVVMNAGRIEQLGEPREVYERPRTRFVAGFIGTSNLITRPVRRLDADGAVLDVGTDESIVAPGAAEVGARAGSALDVTVRPEKMIISSGPPEPGRCVLRGRVTEVVYLGTSTQYAVSAFDGTDLTVFVQNASDSSDIAHRGDDVWLSWLPEHTLPLAAGPVDSSVPTAAGVADS